MTMSWGRQCVPLIPVLGRRRKEDPKLASPGGQISELHTELVRACAKLRWRVVEEDTRSCPLASTWVHAHLHIHVYTYEHTQVKLHFKTCNYYSFENLLMKKILRSSF